MRCTIFVVALAVLGCASQASTYPAALEKKAHEEQAAILRGQDRARVEQLMAQYQKAGMTADMTTTQAHQKVTDYTLQFNDKIKKISADNPNDPQKASQEIAELMREG